MPFFSDLKEKHRELRVHSNQNSSLRVHRSLSWLKAAEQEVSINHDAIFIFLWISFNAMYAKEIDNTSGQEFKDFFRRMVALDKDNHIYNIVWEKFSQPIRLFLDNKFVYGPFWKYHNQISGYEKWECMFEKSKSQFKKALKRQDTNTILTVLFDRLYVLRNQLIHGGATWDGSVNRLQLKDGVNILYSLIPLFIDIMLDNLNEDWGIPYYPVINND